MKFIYSFKKSTFFPLDGNKVEVRTSHTAVFGLFKWTTSRKYPNQLSV
ncbi:MAG: hypothetical protein J0I53_07745 [Chryseobacterium sp.]|nr:hypothetical protein [Chryseobacterium sp.]